MDHRLRSLIAFPCADETLIGSLDMAAGDTGLLIVSGGNDIRCGAHRGMALLAATLADRGYPVFRYDRRGIGDSSGENHGYLSARDDLIAAADAFRAAAPHLTTLVAYGNCDAASTLALYGRDAGADRLILANPWTIEDTDDLPPTAAIRATYRQRLTSPRAWARLLSGRIDIGKALQGLRKASTAPPQTLARRIVGAISGWGDCATVILATGDATAQAYAASAPHLPARRIATPSHSFARPEDQRQLQALVAQLLAGTE